MLDKAQLAGAESLRLLNELATHCDVREPRRLWDDVRRICDRMSLLLGAQFGAHFAEGPFISDLPALGFSRVPIEERRYVAFLIVVASGAVLAPLFNAEGYWEAVEALHEELVTLDHKHHLVHAPAPFVIRHPGAAPV